MDEPPRLSMRSWPFWPNKRALLEDRWLSTLHPPATRWLRLIVAPAASLCGLPFLYEWLNSLRSPPPSFEDCRKIAEGDTVKKWWTSTLASGVLNDYVAPEFLSGVLTPPRSIDRIHEISYFYERESSQRADDPPEWAKGADVWRDRRVFLTVVSDVEAVPPPPVERELSEAEQDAEDYDEMVRLTRDPWWYSVAMHDEGSPRLYNEWLEQRIELRKNITNADAHLWDVLNDTPYNTNWQVEMADMILLPPSRLWLPAKPPNALIPDEALRLTTTWEIRAKDAEPQFVAATLCPRLVKTKEEDVCITINGRPERARSFLWWQNWETRNYVGRECSGTMLRFDYTGPRGVRDGRPLRGSRIPRLLVGVQGWEGAPVIRDDAVDHYTGPDAWFLRNSGKMQELWVYDHDAIDENEAFSAEQFALEEAKPFTGDYQIGPQDISVATYHTVPPPTTHYEDHESIEEGYVAEKTEFDLDMDDIDDDE